MPRPTVVVTRPAGQSRQLTEALLAAGVDVLSFPLLAIGPAADEGPLRDALSHLEDYALAVFVSPNAITHALDALAQVQGVAVAAWPASVPIAVVGPASVAALAERGIAAPAYRVIAPAGASADTGQGAGANPADPLHHDEPESNGGSRFDSEALWAQLDPASLAGRRVLIVRGNGGRDWLADQLRGAGAVVEPVEAYHRSMPLPGAMQWHAVRESLKPGAAPHAWLLTSSEAVRNLDTLAREHLDDAELARLHETQCIAPHARIVEQAATLGFGRLMRAAPGDDGLLAACLQWAAPHIVPPEQFVLVAPPAPEAGARPSDNAVPTSAPATPAAVAPSVQAPPQTAAKSVEAVQAVAATAAPAMAPASSPTPSTKADRVTLDNTTSTPTSSAGATAPPASPPPMPPGAPRAAAAGAGRFPWGWIVLAVMLVALGAAFWWLQQRVDRLTDELARRQQTNDALVQETRVLSRQAQELVKEMQAKVGGLESQVGEARDKQAALEQVYQDLMRNRDDWEVAEIQQLLTNASQQLQLTGNVQVALSALQSADMRLARSDKPQYNLLRRAIARDIARMKAVPDTDLTGAAIKLDEAINQVDLLPLLSSERMLERSEAAARTPASAPAAAQAAADSGNAVGRWFGRLWETVRDEFMQVIRVRRVDDSEALLLSGDQGWFLRENVKLRLLNARLALLSRNEPVFRNDLAAAQAMISRYFDTKSRRVQGVQTLLKQAQAGAVTVQLPTMAESLGALHALKKE